MVVTRATGKGTKEAAEADEPLSQRRRLKTQEKYGQPDIHIVSEDGIKYQSHTLYLKTSCEHFDSLFSKDGCAATSKGQLSILPVPAKSTIVALVLPHIYRRSASSMRQETVANLIAIIELAHHLGMPLLVDHIAIYLEAHVSTAAQQIYPLACKLRLRELRKPSGEVFMRTIDIVEPFDLAKAVGQDNAAWLVNSLW